MGVVLLLEEAGLLLQGARLCVALVSSSSISALIMGVRAQDASRRASVLG